MRPMNSTTFILPLFALAFICAVSFPAVALTRTQFNQRVELRIINQPMSVILRSLMQGGKVPYRSIGESPQDAVDWRFTGSFSAALRQLSNEFGLCFYSDGQKIIVVNAEAAESVIVPVDAPLREALQVLRVSFPWYSANAVRIDRRMNALRLCGPPSFLQPTVDALKSWQDNRLVIVR